MLNIKKFIFSPFYENTFVVWDEVTHSAFIIDPGCYDAHEQQQLDEFIVEGNLKPEYLINTHCHIDHIFGCRYVKEKYKIPYLVPEKDLPLLNYAQKQADAFGIEIDDPPAPDGYLSEEKDILLGRWVMKNLFTPGHTPGEYCLYFPESEFCITGDVLFKESIGRTDLWGGDYKTLLDSIKTKLLILPDNTVIYPGHGESSTIGKEKQYNSFLKTTL